MYSDYFSFKLSLFIYHLLFCSIHLYILCACKINSAMVTFLLFIIRRLLKGKAALHGDLQEDGRVFICLLLLFILAKHKNGIEYIRE